MPAASPRPSSPFSVSPHISPLSTPPNINADPALSASMTSVLTTSDEPPELSFDYEWTNGEYVRISRGSTNSQVSSPPTPVDSPELPKMSTLSISDDRVSSSPPVSLNYPHRRVSLSRSESLPGASPSGTDRSEPSERRSASTMSSMSSLRPFQRVASGPSVLLPNHTPSAAISSASSSVRPSLPDGARASVSKPGGPRRVTMEEYREQAQQNRAKLRAMERELQEEKENFEDEQQSHESPTNGVGVGGPSGRESPPRPSPIGDPPHFTTQAPSFPTRSFSAGHQPTSTSSNSRALADVVPVPQRASLAFPTGPSIGRPIMPGPSRPGRVLRKFQSSFGINKIAEVEAGERESDHLDNGSETDTGAEDQAWSDAGRHVDGSVRQPSALASSHIFTSSSRPRRSASLSEAATPEDHLSSNHAYVPPRNYGSQQGRPGSSLGLASSRVRRGTLEDNARPDRVVDNDNVAHVEMERRVVELAEAQAKATHQQRRQTPSPTNPSHTHLRAQLGHHRRDSDTLRSIPHLQAQTPTTQLARTSSSPTIVDGMPSRMSPSARDLPSSSSNGVSPTARHRRSPTAPEPPTASGLLAPPGLANGNGVGKTWAAGDVRDEEEIKPQSKSSHGQQQPMPASHRSLAPAPHPIHPLNQVGEVKTRNLVVNKKAYARLDMIGKGGSSRVYRVMNNANEIYAIKRVSLDKTDPETMSGYMNEIALLKRLEGNSRIIRLIDSEVRRGPGGSRGYLMLVMECGEIDLARLLQERQKEPLNLVWVAYYWQQMLEAVLVIHHEKIVHSDLKPANFVLVRGQLKLIDFGIANAIANDTTNIQRDHQIGTVNYMSPEAIELPDGQRRLKVGRSSDVWSLGCILYQMIYFQTPFQHLSVYQKMKAIPDMSYEIDFPAYSAPIAPPSRSQPTGQGTPPKRIEHLKRKVKSDAIACMKACLCRNPKKRTPIEVLLKQDWINIQDRDEVVINPFFMRQLLKYGIELGRSNNNPIDMNDMLGEAARLVRELQSVQHASLTPKRPDDEPEETWL